MKTKSTHRILLTGFMGTGKTTVGELVAEALGWTFLDTDQLIEKRVGKTVREIFADQGEARFRALEKEMLCEVLLTENAVIATGGGAIVDPENLRRMRQAGWIVALTASPEKVYERLQDDPTRPLLQVPDPQAEILQLIRTRQPFYEKADDVLDTSEKSCQALAEEIVAQYTARSQR